MDEGGQRIKFQLERLGRDKNAHLRWREIAKALEELEKIVGPPYLIDGKKVGNIAIRLDDGILVSRSGRGAAPLTAEDFVRVVHFDDVHWRAQYWSSREDVEPTSDTPLYWAALVEIPKRLQWSRQPSAGLHGHALEKDDIARRLGIPIFDVEAEFSTPEDQAAFANLVYKYPYPANKIFIRKGHGFFILGDSVQEGLCLAVETFEKGKRLKLL